MIEAGRRHNQDDSGARHREPGSGRDVRRVLMYLMPTRATEVVKSLGGEHAFPFRTNALPPGIAPRSVLEQLSDEELWHVAMLWCRGRNEPPVPKERHVLMDLLLRDCIEGAREGWASGSRRSAPGGAGSTRTGG